MEQDDQNSFEETFDNSLPEQYEQQDILDVLLDANNRAPVVLVGDKGEQIAFEQIAVIPHKVGETPKLYAILKPIDKIEGVAPDEAIVFYIDDSGEGEASLIVETDEKIAVEVFDKYYQLLDEAIGEAEKDSKMTRLLKRLDKKRKWNKE